MENIDFSVVGGSYAGLSADLQSARARRSVLVVDAGQRRNRSVDKAGDTAHDLLASADSCCIKNAKKIEVAQKALPVKRSAGTRHQMCSQH